ncbi:metal transporter Nramp5 [Corchorus olitorius]|uniref:Metal transporter Nramp5 n=1 Tax=Corchorus olitorius TaxID=93759 RepID=A0A1R3KJK9_9ROSI|nr:metal transporter Nramp5 [Corchorus olitorius]
MAAYIVSVIYLTFRKDTVVTYIEPEKNDQARIESGLSNPDGGSFQADSIPYRQDLADIPLPE